MKHSSVWLEQRVKSRLDATSGSEMKKKGGGRNEVRVEKFGLIEVMRGEDCAASTYHIPSIIAITWVHTI